MAKEVLHIKSFEGGINKKADPRDIEDNQIVEAVNVDISNVGRVVVPGDGKSGYNTVNSKGYLVTPNSDPPTFSNYLNPGSGLFAFYHDFNLSQDNVNPDEKPTEFICLNNGAHIKLWGDNAKGMETGAWSDGQLIRDIRLGKIHYIPSDDDDDILNGQFVKPVYYKAGNGLRVGDGNMLEKKASTLASNIASTTSTEAPVASGTGSEYIVSDDAYPNDVNYIKIDSEIMRVTNKSTDNLVVQRGRLGTKATTHASGTQIYHLNVPKILTHINRPMLEAAGASTDLNRWVQDIQFPEAPQAGHFQFYNFDILGRDGNTLLEESVYPDGPGKVNLGINFHNNESDVEFNLLASTAIQLETGNSSEQIVIVTLSDNSGTVLDIDNPSYGFSRGKFLSISGATNDGTVLNGIHEIVGFGSGDGEVKISAEHVTYTQTGQETVVLEDHIIDDNLKNKYIFGMSYVYQGGGGVIQESNITTAYNVASDNFPSNLIDRYEYNFLTQTHNWKTSPSNFGSTSAFSTTETNNWDHVSTSAVCDSNGNDFLWYSSSSQTVSAGTTYYVQMKYTCNGTGTAKIYAGVGPDQTDLSTGMTDGTNYKTITLAASDNLICRNFQITTHASSVDADALISIQVTGLTGDEKLFLKQLSIYHATSAEMSIDNAADFRLAPDTVTSSLSFLCNNSRTISSFYNSWNERIEGFRIYMKQIDMLNNELSSEWMLFYDVNIKDGTYINHTQGVESQDLVLGNIDSYNWTATDTDDRNAVVSTQVETPDLIKTVPLLTYESENGYPADTNLFARYKTAAIIDRKVFIGNIKRVNDTFPDRMVRADIDKFDSFPDDGVHDIDVAPSDGEDIIHLQAVGDKLIQFKQKTAYLIKVTSEGEELEDTWKGAGILSSSQVANASKGVFWINSQALFYYDGEELKNVSSDLFGVESWIVNENKQNPIILGYDEPSNKIIIITPNVSGQSSGGYIYDITNSSIVKCENLFNWYAIYSSTDELQGTQDEF